jgi:type IV pilus biogenesis/stability protein PilW
MSRKSYSIRGRLALELPRGVALSGRQKIGCCACESSQRNQMKVKKGVNAPHQNNATAKSSKAIDSADAVIQQKSRWAGFVAVFAVALLLRLIYLLQIQAIPLFYNLAGDGRTYDDWAQRIAAGAWLGQGVFYQAPLYPYFLGVLQTLFGHDLWAVRVVQVILGSSSCGLLFLVGDKLFGRGAGLAAGLIAACYAPAVFFDVLIEKSILDLFLISCLLFLLVGTNGEAKWSKWLGAGVTLGLLGLSRENALILLPVIALWIAVYFSARPLPDRARWVGLFLAGVVVVLLPVGLRNLTVGGEFKLTTSQLGPNFFIGNNAAADGTYGSVRKVIHEVQLEGPDAKRLAERAMGRELTPGEVSDFWLSRALDYIKHQPASWVRLMAFKWLRVWNAREIEDSDDFYIYQNWSSLLASLARINHFGLLAPLAVFGLLVTYPQWRNLWLLYSTLLSLAASVAAFYVFGRYRFPLVPLLVLFAAAGVMAAIRLYRERMWRFLTMASLFSLCAGVVVNWPMDGASGPGAAGYNNLANAYLKQGNISEATRTALKAIEVDSDYGVAHYNLGNLYAQQGKLDLAQRHFAEALRLYPNYADAYSNYGQLIAERGDIETGIRYFSKAIELNPSVARAHLNLGVALAKQGRFDQATSALRQAVRLTPDSPDASYYLGSVYAAQSRYSDAAEFFKEALRIEPNFVPAHRSLAQLLEMQGRSAEAAEHRREVSRLMNQR